MVILTIILVILAFLGIITQYVGSRAGESIFSYIGGCVIGINYITTDVDFEFEEEGYSKRKHILVVSLFFVSVTYIWFGREEGGEDVY